MTTASKPRIPPECSHILSSGDRCRQVALRGQHFCRLHRDPARRAVAAHNLRTFTLLDTLEAMETPTLLETLHHMLSDLKLPAASDAELALSIAINRLAQLNHSESMAQPQLQAHQHDAPNPLEMNGILADLLKSMA
jgi:hypothetical protein